MQSHRYINRIINTLSAALLALLCAAPALQAETPPLFPFPMPQDHILEPGGRPILLGVTGGIDYNMHSGEFYLTENGIVCCRFDKGSGLGPVAGAKAFIPLAGDLEFSPRVLYESRGGTFTSLSEPLPFFGSGNQVEMVQFEDKLDATINTIGLDLLASYRLTDFGLYVAAGPSAGIVVKKDFVKTESIANPAGVDYLDGSNQKQTFQGELSIINSTLIALRGGVGLTFEVADGIYVNPEVLYGLPLNRISKEDNWKGSTVQATVGVLIAL